MITALYEDADILVIDKPAGLASQPGERVGSTVVSAVERDFHFHPYLVHRLDKETAGCMVIAKHEAAAAAWSALLAGRNVHKKYRAICADSPAKSDGVYTDPLPGGGLPQAATTRFHLLERYDCEAFGGPRFSLVEFELGTGRTHQIRRHSAMHGHPILGDDRYGNFRLNRELRRDLGVRKLMLWACSLELPGTGTIHSAMPPHFSGFFDRLKTTTPPEVS